MIKNHTHRKGGERITDTKALECAIIKAGLSQRELSRLLGISEMSFFNKKNNIFEFKASEIRECKRALHLSDAEVNEIFLRP